MSDALRITAGVEWLQAAAGDAARTPRFSMSGYTGGELRQAWSREPVVIDLAGMSVPDVVPIVAEHDYEIESVLGQGTARVEDGGLLVDGEILADTETARQVVTLGDRGYRWQASVGADVYEHEVVPAGQAATVNGRTFNGPVRVVKRSLLRELSFVTLGADAATAVTITAATAGENSMDEKDMKAEDMPTGPVEGQEHDMPSGPVESKAPTIDMQSIRSEIVREVKEEVLAAVRNSRGPAIHANKPAIDDTQVTIAAIGMIGGLAGVERQYSEPVLEAAHKRSRSIGLQEILVRAARANGYDGSSTRINADSLRPVLRAAFASHSISNVLAATYGKYLLDGFNAVESNWESISVVRPLNDFKTVTGIRVDGGFVFDEVGDDGKLKSADASDATRTLTAKTYGRMSSITRHDIINDDLGALTVVPRRLGRGAALKFNSVFWTEFQSSNSSYYQGASAAAGNALAISSLESAYTAYGQLTDPDGNPLGVTPSMLLVPKGLAITARKLNASANMIVSSLGSTSSRVVEPQANVLAGLLDPVESSYLTTAATAANSVWWLVANPADLPAMEVGFLNGQRQPTVEQAEADFDVLGIQVRGYYDFGVSKGESRACYRMATA